MDKTEIILFIFLSSVMLTIFIVGVVLFVYKYRKRKLLHDKEKGEIEKQHRVDLLNTQLHSQQQTMEHIGQEIHDSVAQKLTLASIYAQRMEFENTVAETGDKLAAISKIINDSLLELRQLSKSLTDSKLQEAGLSELIQMECDQVNTTGICAANFKADKVPEISIAAKSSLFRIVQEFIQNSIKHSGCRKIDIRIEYINGQLAMTLADDGKGFDMEVVQHKGIGLDNIRRRIQVLGGTYTIKSEINKGTILQLTVPEQT